MSDGKQKNDDIDDDVSLDDDTDTDDDTTVVHASGSNVEARRKLEDALEERRLRKQIQDYDFDFD